MQLQAICNSEEPRSLFSNRSNVQVLDDDQ